MASLEGTRNIHEFNGLASDSTCPSICGGHTRAGNALAEDSARATPAGNETGGAGPGQVVQICPACGAPIGRPYIVRLPRRIGPSLRLGPNGGVLLLRRVPGSDEWIEAEYFPPDDEHDDFRPVEPLLPIKLAAILLGLTVKTLYARAPFMASSVKHGNRMFFRRDLLLSVDAAPEAPMPPREAILAERAARRAGGEVQRGGSHRGNCNRRHAGSCGAGGRARPSERDRARVRRSILDDLGK